MNAFVDVAFDSRGNSMDVDVDTIVVRLWIHVCVYILCIYSTILHIKVVPICRFHIMR